MESFLLEMAGKKPVGTVVPFIEKWIKRETETKPGGNARVYRTCLGIYKKFDPELENRKWNQIDFKWVLEFNLWLQKDGAGGNYRAHLMKTLRALYNKAIKEKEASRTDYPFGLDGFNVNTLTEKTRKRHLSDGGIEKVLSARFENKRLEIARRLFVFSYYAYGMSFVDVAMLKRENLRELNGESYIEYRRRKTIHSKGAEPITIPVTSQIMDQLEWFGNNTPIVGDYLLPFLSVVYGNANDEYQHYLNRYRKTREALRDVAEKLGIEPELLTSYAARHTFANDLQLSNVPREAIQEVMGHSEITTTQVYLDGIDNGVKNEYVLNSKIYTQTDNIQPVIIPEVKPKPKKKTGFKLR